jgi:hypothetical protein
VTNVGALSGRRRGPASPRTTSGATSVSSIAFFDGIGTAHSLPLVDGLDRAAGGAGLHREWTSALRPTGADGEDCRWEPTRAFYGEFCDDGTTARFAYRRACRDALRRAEADGCSLFCDLAVEALTTSYGARLRPRLPTVWMVHQPPPPPDGRSLGVHAKVLAANAGKWPDKARMAHARSVLRDLARAGGSFIVPSDAARDRLAKVVPADRVRAAPWPIVSVAAPPPLATGTPGELVAVMPGEARAGKGLDVLLAALPDVDGVTVLDLPTVVTTEAQALVRRRPDPRVRMGTSWASNEEYRGHLAAASLAVLPYSTAAAANGGISASLLDVLSVGLPAVVTTPIARVLPPDYGGAVVVAPGSPAALASGIADAVQRIDELRACAQEQGPAFVLAHHTYERFLQTIVEVGSS